MFDKLREAFKRRKEPGEQANPLGLNDPIAQKTEWGPAAGGGANFKTRKLVHVGPDQLMFKASAGNIAFSLVFLLLGLGIFLGFLIYRLQTHSFQPNADTLVPLLLGLVFALAGGGMLYFASIPAVFDKTRGTYRKSRKDPSKTYGRKSLEGITSLDRIHAIQLVSEYIRSKDSNYYSYELNLVLKDGSRLNVVDHGDEKQLRTDAQTLSVFLDVPVWDAI